MSGEIPFTRLMCRELEAINAVVIPYVASMKNRPHVPDRIVWHAYWHGFIEFKGVTTALRPGQRIMICELNKRVPGSAWVVRAQFSSGNSTVGWIQQIQGKELVTVAKFSTALELIHDLRDLQKWLTTTSPS